jgi:hypothetical protein
MLELHVNALDVISTLDNIAVRQIPFATAKALNKTALDFQQAERERLRLFFTLRRPDFIERQTVKLLRPADGGSYYATKGNLSATIGNDPKADFMAKFEEGGEKTATDGGDIAIPIDARTNKRDIVLAAQRPKALFASSPETTFAIRPGDQSHLTPGIYQRTADHHVRFMYELEPEVRIDPLLGFEETAEQVVQERWAINFSEAFENALATAK